MGLSLGSMIRLAPLANLKLEDLTIEHAAAVLEELGVKIPVTDELLRAGVSLLRGEDINSVADMIQSPDSVRKLVEFMGRGFGLVDSGSLEDSVVATQLQQQAPDVPVGLITGHAGWRMPGE